MAGPGALFTMSTAAAPAFCRRPRALRARRSTRGDPTFPRQPDVLGRVATERMLPAAFFKTFDGERESIAEVAPLAIDRLQGRATAEMTSAPGTSEWIARGTLMPSVPSQANRSCTGWNQNFRPGETTRRPPFAALDAAPRLVVGAAESATERHVDHVQWAKAAHRMASTVHVGEPLATETRRVTGRPYGAGRRTNEPTEFDRVVVALVRTV